MACTPYDSCSVCNRKCCSICTPIGDRRMMAYIRWHRQWVCSRTSDQQRCCNWSCSSSHHNRHRGCSLVRLGQSTPGENDQKNSRPPAGKKSRREWNSCKLVLSSWMYCKPGQSNWMRCNRKNWRQRRRPKPKWSKLPIVHQGVEK